MAFGFRTGATGGTVEPSLLAEPGKTGAGAYLRRDINSLLFKDKCLEVQPWVGKIPWRRKWLPTPVFLPGEFHELRSLAGYSPWGHKESDITEQLTFSLLLSLSFQLDNR